MNNTIPKLVIGPSPIFCQKAENVKEVNDEMRLLMDNMLLALHEYKGIGMAATHIGILKRIVVIQLSREDTPIFMANPEIIKSSKETNIYKEGSISFPNIFVDITRPKQVEIEFIDYNNKKQTLDADGLLATCAQHEIDQTNGILFINHASKLKQQMLIKKAHKYKKSISS